MTDDRAGYWLDVARENLAAPPRATRPGSDPAIQLAGPRDDDFLFIFGEARRCLHDRLADTIVIKA